MINASTLLIRNEEKFLASSLGEEAVMMNVENGNFIGVNSVGAEIWHLLKEPIQVDDLVKHLTTRYNIDEMQCSIETIAYLNKMMDEELLSLA